MPSRYPPSGVRVPPWGGAGGRYQGRGEQITLGISEAPGGGGGGQIPPLGVPNATGGAFVHRGEVPLGVQNAPGGTDCPQWGPKCPGRGGRYPWGGQITLGRGADTPSAHSAVNQRLATPPASTTPQSQPRFAKWAWFQVTPPSARHCPSLRALRMRTSASHPPFSVVLPGSVSTSGSAAAAEPGGRHVHSIPFPAAAPDRAAVVQPGPAVRGRDRTAAAGAAAPGLGAAGGPGGGFAVSSGVGPTQGSVGRSLCVRPVRRWRCCSGGARGRGWGGLSRWGWF